MNPYIRRLTLVRASVAMCLLAHLPLHAAGFEQHDVHEHGIAAINIALEREKVSLEITAPAINVVGFEHEPTTAQEKSAAAEALAMLKSASGFIGVPSEARCRHTASHVTPPRWTEDAHEHEADETAGVHHHQHEHSEYGVRLTYVCDVPQKLEWLEPWVLGRLHNAKEAHVRVITPDDQYSLKVRDPKERISLRGSLQ